MALMDQAVFDGWGHGAVLAVFGFRVLPGGRFHLEQK